MLKNLRLDLSIYKKIPKFRDFFVFIRNHLGTFVSIKKDQQLSMKKLLGILFLLSFISCSVDSDSDINFFYEGVAIEAVEQIPDTLEVGEVYIFKLKYFRPSTCHNFNSLDLAQNQNNIHVAIISTVFTDQVCENFEEDELLEAELSFRPQLENSYVLNFWQGRNEEGMDQFLTFEIPVIDSSNN